MKLIFEIWQVENLVNMFNAYSNAEEVKRGSKHRPAVAEKLKARVKTVLDTSLLRIQANRAWMAKYYERVKNWLQKNV